MPESSENAPAEGELDPGGRHADGFMPVGRRSPQECLSCCMGTRLPQEGGLPETGEGLQPTDLVAQKGAVWLFQGQKLGPTPLGCTAVGDAVPMLFALLNLSAVNPAFLWLWWICSQ